jgi:hypothetical protein
MNLPLGSFFHLIYKFFCKFFGNGLIFNLLFNSVYYVVLVIFPFFLINFLEIF